MTDEIERLHREACENGKRVYKDPETGYWVMTQIALENRGHCCLSGCRHCPYGYHQGGTKKGSTS